MSASNPMRIFGSPHRCGEIPLNKNKSPSYEDYWPKIMSEKCRQSQSTKNWITPEMCNLPFFERLRTFYGFVQHFYENLNFSEGKRKQIFLKIFLLNVNHYSSPSARDDGCTGFGNGCVGVGIVDVRVDGLAHLPHYIVPL